MARSGGDLVQNNLSRGLITEATGLNFPENAVTDADNVIFEKIGKVRRRLGLDIEKDAETILFNETTGIIQEFVWRSVGKNGGVTFLVMQVGSELLFYEMTSSVLSTNIQETRFDLNSLKAPGAGPVDMTPITMAAGAGYLFIVHHNLEPHIIKWNRVTDKLEATSVSISIRDYKGLDDGLAPDEEPLALSKEHYYNLRNQGWDHKVRAGTVSNEAGATGQGSIFTEFFLGGQHGS